jgi:hypothetical protein
VHALVDIPFSSFLVQTSRLKEEFGAAKSWFVELVTDPRPQKQIHTASIDSLANRSRISIQNPTTCVCELKCAI